MTQIIKILGNRQTGKTTLLGHYIKDAQAKGMKVLLTGKTLCRVKFAEESGGFKADLRKGDIMMGTNVRCDVLAIEEDDVEHYRDYAYSQMYLPYLRDSCIIIITGDLQNGI